MLFQDGSRFEGHFDNGVFHGKGRIISEEGDVYTGDWNTGKVEGHGILIQSESGYRYQGEWL